LGFGFIILTVFSDIVFSDVVATFCPPAGDLPKGEKASKSNVEVEILRSKFIPFSDDRLKMG